MISDRVMHILLYRYQCTSACCHKRRQTGNVSRGTAQSSTRTHTHTHASRSGDDHCRSTALQICHQCCLSIHIRPSPLLASYMYRIATQSNYNSWKPDIELNMPARSITTEQIIFS